MRGTELLRLVWLNINQNKFKTIMTSIGIVVGAATIVLVIAIGRGGQMDVAEQFQNLNAGAIDVSYEWADTSQSQSGQSGGFSFDFFGGIGNLFSGGGAGGGQDAGAGGQQGGRGGMGGQFPGMPGQNRDDASGEDGGMELPEGFGEGGEMELPEGFGEGGEMELPEGFGEGGEMELPEGFGEGGEMELPEGFGEGGEMELPEGFGEGGEMELPEGFGEGGEMGLPEGFGTGGDTQTQDSEASGEEGEGAENGQSQRQSGESDEGSGLTENGQSQEQPGGPDEESGLTESGEGQDGQEAGETESETEDPLEDRMNQENIILSQEDVEDIETFVPGITGATISYTVRGSVEGGELEEAQTYTVAGVKSNYLMISNLTMGVGEFLTDQDDESKNKVCVLGYSVAREIFGSAEEAWESTIYIEDRAYTVIGVVSSSQLVSAGISPNEAVFIPYETGKKYITGTSVSPVITVVAEDVNQVDRVMEDIETVLDENYSNAQFTYSDAGSQMEAAETSNQILTLLLAAMAAIVFVVGGIGIMNVLFVSVKERTNEIGILKAIGGSRKMILFEFLLESTAISFLGGILGVGLSFAVTPVVQHYGIRVETNPTAWLAALGFALLTGTLFGIYPAWKASRLVPVEALNAE